MEKILQYDEEVLIFKVSNNMKEDEYIKGKVISSRESEDLSHHGSPWYEKIYDVRGEDGHIYTGTYNRDIIGKDIFFRTPEDHIKYLQEKINKNYRKIYDINCENETYREIINSLKEKELSNSKVKIKIKIKASYK